MSLRLQQMHQAILQRQIGVGGRHGVVVSSRLAW